MSDTLLEIQQTGMWRGHVAEVVHLIGQRDQGWTSTSVWGDAAEYLDTSQALINTPTTGQTLYLVSTSANDAAAGTGARTVKTTYLDVNGLQQTRTDTLNGTTPVNIGSGYSFIQWCEVMTVGSGGLAAGNVSVSSTNGPATVATTFELIASGANLSQSCRYKVPSDCTGYLYDWFAGAVTGNMDTRVRADTATDEGPTPNVFHFKDAAFLTAGQNVTQELHWQKLPAGTIVKVSAKPGGIAAGNRLSVNLSLIRVAN